jgi:hypothetical protein
VRDREFLAQNLISHSRDTEYVTRTKELFPEVPLGDMEGVEVAYIKVEESEKQSRLKDALNWALPNAWTWTKLERKARPLSYDRYLAGEKEFGPRQISTTAQIISSLIIATVAGGFIIAPIAIMRSYSYHGQNLLTVSLWVILFGFFLAAVVQAKNQEIFIATATYAAVLVVFVGAAGSTG